MEVQTIHLATGLAALGAGVVVASVMSSSRDDDATGLRDAGVEVVHLGAVGRLARAASVLRLARLARRSELVHCTEFDASLWGRLAGMLVGRPSVVSVHTGAQARRFETGRLGRAREHVIRLHNRLLDPFTPRTIACARSQVPLLVSEGVAPEKIVVVPNGVPVPALRAQAGSTLTRAGLGIPEDAKVLAQVGRIHGWKGQSLTLETVRRLREDVGDVHVVFAGTGPDLEPLKARARALGADWVHFLGFQPSVGAVFALADLAVLPSQGEAMPMVILEALALGVPVVATDVGDIRAVLEATGAGVTVPVDDEEAYLVACREILTSDELAGRLAANARGAEAEIDAATMVRRYASVFDDALAAR